jgi:hypothetical protein
LFGRLLYLKSASFHELIDISDSFEEGGGSHRGSQMDGTLQAFLQFLKENGRAGFALFAAGVSTWALT